MFARWISLYICSLRRTTYERKVHGALFRREDLEALAAAFEREGEMREKEERRIALKREQFEESMVSKQSTAVRWLARTSRDLDTFAFFFAWILLVITFICHNLDRKALLSFQNFAAAHVMTTVVRGPARYQQTGSRQVSRLFVSTFY